MIDPALSGKTALVTGCNNPYGTGAAIALALADQGVNICAHFYRPPQMSPTSNHAMGEGFHRAQQDQTADWLVERLSALDVGATMVEADLADPGAVATLFDAAESLGPTQILINNAAYCMPDSLRPDSTGRAAADGVAMVRVSAETVDRHFAVNARAPALAMAEFAERHVAREDNWGRIVNVSTDGAAVFPTEVSYGASKFALESYSRSAALELASNGITINVVSLGAVQTGWISPELEPVISAATPLGRAGTPEDVADVVVFLASHQARWLTGQRLFVGGGHSMT